MENYHPESTASSFVKVVLPIAVPKLYTYAVPEEMMGLIQVGSRVEIQFGKNKLYAGIVAEFSESAPSEYIPKTILSLIDMHPVVTQTQLDFWKWIAQYYCCTIGEVMAAALPSGLRLASETRVVLSPLFDDNFQGLNDKEFMITEALSIQNELSLDDIQKILNQKSVSSLISSLLEKKLIYLKEELQEKYKPKKIACVRLGSTYRDQPKLLQEAFEKLSRSERQVETLMAFVQLSKKLKHIQRTELCKKANVDSSVIKAMVKKQVFEVYSRDISRLGSYDEEVEVIKTMTEQQEAALEKIENDFENGNTVLLHGVTGSGKTRVYVELMKKAMAKGEQVLYLLPEIALTTQITNRLQKIFGDDVLIYHSRLNNNERVELWGAASKGKPITIGVRSSLFLPFNNLKLIIVDEEHDTSFKQFDPAPRYSARDASIYLAGISKAKVLLGTATPSLESYTNAKKGKYNLVELPARYGGIEMPQILVVDMKEETKRKLNQSHFSSKLLEELKQVLENGEQAILFQNRRGHSPTMRCLTCGWNAQCVNCDVSLTYHKFFDDLRCHYCGFQSHIPNSCPACGSSELIMKGFGTEKIEDELKTFLPGARIARMDFDTVRGKHAHATLINDFEEHRLDILVGTQMVTKGLDFDNVSVVGVLSADHLLHFPDFRSTERTFQLITQVAGRSGRKNKQGKVLIQAYNIAHPVLNEIRNNDFQGFYKRELRERNEFKYPPFYRLIRITLKHKKIKPLNEAAKVYAGMLKKQLGSRVKGPGIPGIPRVRGYYLLDILLKLERNAELIRQSKEIIGDSSLKLHKMPGFSTIRIIVDVDPY